MGQISNFTGQMQMEISFLVDGERFKARMLREKTNKILGSDVGKTEKISIRLHQGEKSIFVESFQEEGGAPELR
jgi:hypothetical protein